MELVPVEFPEEAEYWTHQLLSLIVYHLSDTGEIPSELSFQPPEDPNWALRASERLLDQIDVRKEASNDRLKPLFERVILGLSQSFHTALSRPCTESLEVERLIPLLIAKQSVLMYQAIYGLRLGRCEGQLLRNVFASLDPTALRVGVDVLCKSPPNDWIDVSLSITPLIQSDRWQIEHVFPQLLQTSNPAVLATALDLANHAFRKRSLATHPAADQFEFLLQLLGGTTRQLELLEEDPSRFSTRVEEIQKMLFDSVSLCVSLCDYFALRGDTRAIAKLTQALDLKHRRIKIEAAFALAKLGEDRATELLCSLASDDACRRRVLQYAKELAIDAKIDEQWKTSLALARSDLALWLSQPENFSLPPTSMELLEQRTLYWPGFENLQECFLFRFRYELGGENYTNLAFSGPAAFASSDDLTWLSNDDAFAVFFSHDIDHPDAIVLPPFQWQTDDKRLIGYLETQLEELGYEQVSTKLLSKLFEHAAIVATAKKNDEPATVVFDGEEAQCLSGKVSPWLAGSLWRGRIAMATFND